MILIAGPCVIESYDVLRTTAEYIKEKLPPDIEFYFKSSCVKDNRTKLVNYKGIGFTKGLELLLKIKEEFGLSITTDFHSPRDIETFGHVVDLIQIPAFLSMQTSMAEAAASKNKPVSIKKGQFLGPLEAVKMWKKYKDLGIKKVFLIDRGTQLGYNQVFMDPRHIAIWKKEGATVLVDITHPNKNYPGDKLTNSLSLAKSSLAAEADGIFMEIHPSPEDALCDAQTQISLNKVYQFFELF